MKKNLRLILLCIPLLIAAIIVGIFLVRFRSAGEVLLTGVTATDQGAYLLQAREVGARQIRLSRGESARLTLSPGGRYAAFTCKKDGHSRETLLFDLTQPRKPLLQLPQSAKVLLPLDDGSLLYIANDNLYRATKQQTTLLAENIRELGAVSGDGASIYCFRPVAENQLDLCRVDLSDGSLTTLLENAHHPSLQVVQDEAGQDIVICAQMHTYEFTAYDLVLDTLEEADAASNDEDAQKRNALRTRLKEKIITTTGRTVWRIVGSERQLLAEGVKEAYFCDPITGILVYRHCQRFAAPVEIQTLREAYIPERMQWHFSLLGTEFTPPELNGAFDAEPQFSGDGSLAILKDSVLYLWQMEDGVLGEAKVMMDPAQDFALLRSSDGGSCLYYKTSSGLLRRHDGTQDFILSANVLSAHLPCRVLPVLYS